MSLLSPFPQVPGVQWRHATPQDLPLLAAFFETAHPGHGMDLALLERQDSYRVPGEAFQRLLAFRGGADGPRLVGVSEVGVPRSENYPGWLHVGVDVHPEEQGGALPAALLAVAEAYAGQRGASTLLSRVKEYAPERQLLEAHGYAEHDRLFPSTLDLRALDFTRFAPQEAQVRAAGVTLRPLSALDNCAQGQLSATGQRRLYGLIAALLRDVPSRTPISVWPFELWQQRFMPYLHHPEGLLIALSPQGNWIGLNELHQPIPAQPGTLQNGLTGVLPEWRGHHIALALKLEGARAGLQRGYTHARTSNHSLNGPMLAINEKLGFQREEATLTLKKEA